MEEITNELNNWLVDKIKNMFVLNKNVFQIKPSADTDFITNIYNLETALNNGDGFFPLKSNVNQNVEGNIWALHTAFSELAGVKEYSIIFADDNTYSFKDGVEIDL